MEAKIFTGEIERYHKRWLANALWIPGNGHLGIDLLSPTSVYEQATYSDNFAIELKSKMRGYSFNFAINADQVNDFVKKQPEKEFYWAFMFYTFSKRVKDTKITEDLEALVTEREVWCIRWNWIRQFPISRPQRSGPFRYVPAYKFPKPERMTTFYEEKGRVYAPKDSNLEAHLINRAMSLE